MTSDRRLRLQTELDAVRQEVDALAAELQQPSAKEWLRRSTSYTLDDVEMLLRNADRAQPGWEDMWLGVAEEWLEIAHRQIETVRKARADYGPDLVVIG
jgi:hypothetical protein